MKIAYICADFGVTIFDHKGASIHITEMVYYVHDWLDEIKGKGTALSMDRILVERDSILKREVTSSIFGTQKVYAQN